MSDELEKLECEQDGAATNQGAVPQSEVVAPDDGRSKKSGKAKKPKKKKPKFVDDGRTVYSMEGLSRHKSDKESLDLTKKERRALIKAALAHYLPILLGVIGCFSVAAILMYLWLH